jgi:hypothetical protein
MARNLIPARRAYSRATGLLGPHARTSACGWWNQIVTDGLKRRMSRACLRLRERPGARILRVPRPAPGPPLGREVAVEVDAACVLAPAEREAVRVEVRDDPEIDCGRGARKDAGDRGPGALVPVDAADDERPRRARRVSGAEGPDRAATRRASDANAALRVGPDADVHVVVVVDQPLDLPPRSAEADVWPDEDLQGAGLDEAGHELLAEDAIDLSGARRPELLPVEPRVVDVHVTPVLMRRVTTPAETLVEDASVRSRQVANAHAARLGMRSGVLVDHPQQHPEQPVAAPAAPRPVRRALLDGVPGEEVLALGR